MKRPSRFLFVLLFPLIPLFPVMLKPLAGGNSRVSPSAADPSSGDPPPQPPVVEVTAAQKIKKDPSIPVHGTLTGRNRITLSPPVEGRITRIAVQPGDPVMPGQTIAFLENPQLENELRQALGNRESARSQVHLAEAALDEAVRQWEARRISREAELLGLANQRQRLREEARKVEQKEELLALDGISQEEFRQASQALEMNRRTLEQRIMELEAASIGMRDKDIRQAGYQVPTGEEERLSLLRKISTQQARARLQAAQSRVTALDCTIRGLENLLDQLQLRSPSRGRVEVIHHYAGEQHQKGKPLVTLIRSQSLYAQFTVSESKAASISPGSAVQLKVPALNSRALQCRVSMILPTLERGTGNLRLKARVENPQGDLFPGMFIRGALPLGPPEEFIAVSPQVLAETGEEKAVCYAVKNKRVQRLKIEIGGMHRGKTIVTAGLDGNEQLILSPPPSLRMGQRVQPVPREEIKK